MASEERSRTKIGLITVSLPGERVDLAKKSDELAYKNLKKRDLDILYSKKIAMDEQEIILRVKQYEQENVDCIVYLIGTWIYPPSVVKAIQNVTVPCIIWAVPEPASFSLVGAHVIHGFLGEIGTKHKLFYGNPDEDTVVDGIAAYARAAMAYRRIRNTRFGFIGGLNLGNYTAVSDLAQINSLFGIETIHIDQLVLIDKAQNSTDQKCEELYSTIVEKYGKVHAPKSVMLRSIKLYKAFLEIVEEYHLDFTGIKCLEEVINMYGSCCLAIALANATGIMTACQSDINAGIMMEVFHLLSKESVAFGDIVTVDRSNKIITMANCGTMAIDLAKTPEDVEWGYQYEYMGKSRGATAAFCCKPGEVTLAALGRIEGNYVMHICKGKAIAKERKALAEVRDIWPQAFIKVDIDIEKFIQNVRTGHSLVCYGDYMAELVNYCELLGIIPNLD